VTLHRANFAGATFDQCPFAATFGGVTSVAFSPLGDDASFGNGQTLATSDTAGGIQLWQMADGQQLKLFKGHNSWVWQVAFSPVHPMLACGGQDHQVRRWDLHLDECLRVLTEHRGIVTAVAFSPDGRTLYSGGADKLINVWDMEAGRCTATWTGHQSWVWSLQYDPASSVLVSAGQDETIRHWSTATGACLKIQQSDRPYKGMRFDGAFGLTDAQRSTLNALGAKDRREQP